MSLDVEALQSELQAIRSERETAAERIQLFSFRGRGRGRGRGVFPGRRAPSEAKADDADGAEAPGRGLSASLRDRLGNRDGEEKPSLAPRRRDEHDHRYSKQEIHERRYSRQQYREPFEADAAEVAELQEPLPGSNTDRLASAVVETSGNLDEGASREAKLAQEGKRNPGQQKRNKRLFGALLGTLQKFQEEDQRFKRSRLAQTRAEAEQRAEQRAQVENERVRERQKQEIAKAKLAEINRKRELDLKLQAKEREMNLALKVEREMKLTQWLKTGARPPLLWLPKTHNEDTRLLMEQRLTDVSAWRDAQLERLEKDKEEIQARFKPILPRVRDEAEKKLEREDVDMTEAEPADSETLLMEPTPLPVEIDRYAGADTEVIEEVNLEAEKGLVGQTDV